MKAKLTIWSAVPALMAAIAIAGCGGGSGTTGGGGTSGEGNTTAAASQAAGKGGAAAIGTGRAGDLGIVLVDVKKLTVYDFHKDRGTKSSCYGACESAWPPVLTGGAPKARGAAVASKLGTTRRRDGTLQVTYAGHPLYTYAGDRKPGEATGNDISQFGAQWYSLLPSGEEPED